MSDPKKPSGLAGRLGAVLRGAEDANLGRRAVREGLLSEAELAGALRHEGGQARVEELLRSKGVSPDDLRRLRGEIDREEFALFRPHRQPPPEVQAVQAEHDRRIAEFVLIERLGQGGLGEVWKAWDLRLGRWVAIKLPAPTPDFEAAAKRFTREALAAARLSHPNIISIYRVAEESGRPFIVMQYIEGRTLAHAQPPLREALGIVRAVAQAVQYAHEQGVVHRDLKPGNIMIGGDGRPVVLDFGLAHLDDPGRHPSREGLVAGTAAYMSPEQARGDAAARAPATDVYSLGATLYELVTGRPPFEGSSFAATLERVLHREVPAPSALRAGIPRDVESVILKAMEKDPARRYATAREFADDLDRCLRGEAIAARRTELGRRIRRLARGHPRAVTAGWVALLAVLLSAGFAAVTSRRAERLEREGKAKAATDVVRLSVEAALRLRRTGANDQMAGFRDSAVAAWREADSAGAVTAELCQRLGRLYRAFLDDVRADELQARALELEPGYAPAAYERAVLAFRRGTAVPGPARGPVAEGIAALLGGDFWRAREILEKAVEAAPDLEEGWEALARAWIGKTGLHSPPAEQEAAYGRAEAALTRGIARDRGYAPHWILRGGARAARGWLRKETGRDPLGDYHGAEDDFSEALRLGAGTEARVRRASVRSLLALHRIDLGEDPGPHFAAAEADLADASAPRVERARLRRFRAAWKLERGGDPRADCEAGEREATAALDRDGTRAEAWMERGLLRGIRSAAARQEDPGAESDFKEAIRLGTAVPEVWEARAFVRLERARVRPSCCHDFRLIEADLDRAIEQAPFFNRARVARAKVRRLRAAFLRKPGEDPGPDFEKAKEELAQVLKLNPLSTPAWVEQGHLFLEWGRWRTRASDTGGARELYIQAIRSYEEATRLDATFADLFREPVREARRALLGSN